MGLCSAHCSVGVVGCCFRCFWKFEVWCLVSSWALAVAAPYFGVAAITIFTLLMGGIVFSIVLPSLGFTGAFCMNLFVATAFLYVIEEIMNKYCVSCLL